MVESKPASLLRGLVQGSPDALTSPEAALPSLFEEACRQGLAGWLLRAIDGGVLVWAAPLRAALVAERRRLLARALAQAAACAQASARLAERGIRSLPLKGIVLADAVCELESDRPMSDSDLLVLDDWREALATLVAQGFSVLARGDHAWALRDPATNQVIELHRSVTSAPGLFPLDREGLWSRRRPGRRQQPFLPSPEDLLLQLALHASFQHGFVLSLVQWLDFRRVLEHDTIDYERLCAAAHDARAAAPLAAALVAAEAVVGAPYPEPLAALRARLPRGLVAFLRPRLEAPLRLVGPAAPALARARFELLAGRRPELLWRTLVLPEDAAGDPRLLARLLQAVSRSIRLARSHSAVPELAPKRAAQPAATASAPAHDVDLAEGTLRECLASFPQVRLTVTGSCMAPAIANGERIELVATSLRPPRLGDVVLARQPGGLRLHRLVWGPPLTRSRWRTKADRGSCLDPPLLPTDVLATVSAIETRPKTRLRRPGRALVSLAAALVAHFRAPGEERP